MCYCRRLVPFVRGPGSQALPSLGFQFHVHTLAGDSRCPCALLTLSGALVGSWFSVVPGNELRQWTLPGSCLHPSSCPTPVVAQWMFVECLGCLITAVCTVHMCTHHASSPVPEFALTLPAPSGVLFLGLVCPHSCLFY